MFFYPILLSCKPLIPLIMIPLIILEIVGYFSPDNSIIIISNGFSAYIGRQSNINSHSKEVIKSGARKKLIAADYRGDFISLSLSNMCKLDSSANSKICQGGSSHYCICF